MINARTLSLVGGLFCFAFAGYSHITKATPLVFQVCMATKDGKRICVPDDMPCKPIEYSKSSPFGQCI